MSKTRTRMGRAEIGAKRAGRQGFLAKAPRERARPGEAPRIHTPSVVQEGAVLGTDTVVGAFTFVAAGARIGAGTRIQGHTSVWAGVTLGQDVFVGPGAMFTNVRRPRARFPRYPNSVTDWDLTVVDDGATLGARSTVVAPAHVGRCAMVGAGATVTRDVPAHAEVVGVPARIVGWACTCGATLGRSRPPARGARPAVCARCGRTFLRDGDGLREADLTSAR